MLPSGSLYFWAGVQVHLHLFCRTRKPSGQGLNQQHADHGETWNSGKSVMQQKLPPLLLNRKPRK